MRSGSLIPLRQRIAHYPANRDSLPAIYWFYAVVCGKDDFLFSSQCDSSTAWVRFQFLRFITSIRRNVPVRSPNTLRHSQKQQNTSCNRGENRCLNNNWLGIIPSQSSGATYRVRTGDLRFTRASLYRLS